jgi:spermidine synthase
MLRIANDLSILKRLNHNSLSADRVTVFAEDAFTFINQAGIKYDRVIIDMPDPHNEAINKLYSREFYTMIKRRMSANGVLATQSSSPFFTRQVFWSIEKTLANVFKHTLSYHTALPSFGIWGFNMASVATPFPARYEFDVPTRAITAETMLASTVFTKDMAKIPTPVNSLMEPKLYQLYIDDLKR